MSKSSFFNFLSSSYNAALESKAPSRHEEQNNKRGADKQNHAEPPMSTNTAPYRPLKTEQPEQQSQSLELPGLKELEALHKNKSVNNGYTHHYYKLDSDDENEEDSKVESYSNGNSNENNPHLRSSNHASLGPISPQTIFGHESERSKYERDFHHQQIAENENERALIISVEYDQDRFLNSVQSPPPIKRHLTEITSPKQMEVDNTLSPMGDITPPPHWHWF